MSKQIDDMLMLSRIIRSEMQIEKVDLSAIALNFASELKQGQPQRKVEFVIQEGIIVEGDRNLLEEVILNLMRNAWKFSSKHDTALIEVGSVDILGENVYFVKDDGAGFDMKYAEKLFMPFRRMHSEAEFPGNGIGLATVQRIIRRHGGRIWAESAVEKGTAIYFTVGLAMCEGK
ncbi:MAG: hypothetical protein EHM12_02120 [Dehalococcoidia bacterium]|nr:MAG: hypothetical protein EHM12_02120 [Dehalococcoidia bacterium]